MDSKEEWMGEVLANFILSEHDVLGSKAPTIRRKISGVRFFHIISGAGDFTKVGARWGIILRGLTMKIER